MPLAPVHGWQVVLWGNDVCSCMLAVCGRGALRLVLVTVFVRVRAYAPVVDVVVVPVAVLVVVVVVDVVVVTWMQCFEPSFAVRVGPTTDQSSQYPLDGVNTKLAHAPFASHSAVHASIV